MKIRFEGEALFVSTPDPDWLEKSLGEGVSDLKHERLDETILLTAGTEELQQFLLAHANEAFDDPDSLSRRVQELSR